VEQKTRSMYFAFSRQMFGGRFRLEVAGPTVYTREKEANASRPAAAAAVQRLTAKLVLLCVIAAVAAKDGALV
jgi:hypothetical protein